MSPFAIDVAKFRPATAENPNEQLLMSLDPAKPPTVPIPHYEFPLVVYKHPREPFRKVEHRNNMHELVDVEMIQNEHLTKIIACVRHMEKPVEKGVCAACKDTLEAALEDGWVLNPYVPQSRKDPLANVYESTAKTKESKKTA